VSDELSTGFQTLLRSHSLLYIASFSKSKLTNNIEYVKNVHETLYKDITSGGRPDGV
jgi:hypothetical protein